MTKKKMSWLYNLKIWLIRFQNSAAGKWGARVFSLAATTAIIAFLLYKLTLMGWDNVINSLPLNPWYYILILAIFFTLPVFQVFIFRVNWKISRWELFLVTLNKRVLDREVLGYSGEMYVYFWARKRLGASDREILHVIKDNAIISSVASTLAAVALLGVFFAFERVSLPREWANPSFYQITVIIFCLILVAGLAVRFRKNILHLNRRDVMTIFFYNMIRLVVIHGLQLIQWIVIMPETPPINWMTLMAWQIIIERIPLLPSRDLLFVSTGIEMAGLIHVSSSAMAGLLLVNSVVYKILNLFFFIFTYFSLKHIKKELPEPLAETPPVF